MAGDVSATCGCKPNPLACPTGEILATHFHLAKTELVRGPDRQLALEEASRAGFARTGKLDIMRQIIADLNSPKDIDGILAHVSSNLASHSHGAVAEPLLDEIWDPRRAAYARCSFVASVWRRAIPP